MSYLVAADMIFLLHIAFILFVVAGGLLVLKWSRLIWLHIPAAVWGAWIEFNGWICPLTPLENRLRIIGGDSDFTGGFIEKYIAPVIYPLGLTRGFQLTLGAIVIVLNMTFYSCLLLRNFRQRNKNV